MSEQSKKISREELFEAVWSKPIKTLAQEWNSTYPQIVGACLEMDLPRPSQGHWQLIALGQPPHKPSLPKRGANVPQEVTLRIRPVHGAQEPQSLLSAKSAKAEPDQQQPADSGAVRRAADEGAPATQPPKEPDLQAAAENAVLNILRQATAIDFWRESISESHSPGWLASWFGHGDGKKLTEATLVSALKNIRKDYRSFHVTVTEARDHYNPFEKTWSVAICLREGFEWKDAWEEAWTFAEKPNPHCLTDNALRLYEWAKGAKNLHAMMLRKTIGAQARLRRTYDHIEKHLCEIRLKAAPDLQWECEPNSWHGKMRVWFEKRDFVYYQHGPLNPPLGLNVTEIYRHELERFKSWLYIEIPKPEFPNGQQTVGIFDIRDRKTLSKIFSRLPADCGPYGKLPDFFRASRWVDGLEIRTLFADGAGPWIVTCQPGKGFTWADIKERLKAKAQEVPLEKKYRLSADSRTLLAWIMELRNDEYLLGMFTPGLEDRFDGDIGLRADCGKENVRTYVELLVEEINQRTEFDLRVVRWHYRYQDATRLLVRKKQPDLDQTVEVVRRFALTKSKVLDASTVRSMIVELVGE